MFSQSSKLFRLKASIFILFDNDTKFLHFNDSIGHKPAIIFRLLRGDEGERSIRAGNPSGLIRSIYDDPMMEMHFRGFSVPTMVCVRNLGTTNMARG